MLLGLAPEETANLTLVGPVHQTSVDTLERLAATWGLLVIGLACLAPIIQQRRTSRAA
jgi:hypothetical protein